MPPVSPSEKTSFSATMLDVIKGIVFEILGFQKSKIIFYLKWTTFATKILPSKNLNLYLCTVKKIMIVKVGLTSGRSDVIGATK